MSLDRVLVRCRSCGTLNRVPSEKLFADPICGQCRTLLDVPRYPLNITTNSFDQQLRDWPEFLLVEFWAKWCGYCRMIEPFLNELAAKRAGRLKIIKVDVDAEPVLAHRFTIKATPTFVLYRNNVQLGRIDGAPQQNRDLELWVDQAMMRT